MFSSVEMVICIMIYNINISDHIQYFVNRSQCILRRSTSSVFEDPNLSLIIVCGF